jgi:DNA mismatch repair protein MutS
MDCIYIMSLIKQYFDLLQENKSKYGENTFLLMQVGSFFEVYSKEESDKNMQTFSKVCDLRIASKGEHYMAGFRDYMLDKYLGKIVEESYTAVVYVQEDKTGVIERKLQGVYSPGTSFVEEEKKLSNHFACVWIYKTSKNPSLILFGISVLNIFTGKVHVFEYEELYYHNPTTYDNMERFFSIYEPTETVLLHNLEKEKIDSIVQYLNLKQKVTVLHEKDPIYGKQITRCEAQRYQVEIIQRYYPHLNKSLLLDSLFEKMIALQSLCFLLDYVQQHNSGLTHKLSDPTMEQLEQSLTLANHSLKQLNILDTDYTGSYSSVLSFLNSCRTKIGRREFQSLLLQPSRDKVKLQESYNLIEYCLEQKYDTTSILLQVCDVERMERKRILEKLSPRDYFLLYDTCRLLASYLTIGDPWMNSLQSAEVIHEIRKIQEKMNTYLNVEKAEHVTELDDTCDLLIHQGIDLELDNACRNKLECSAKFKSIYTYLNGCYLFLDKKCEEAFKIHETDKSGVSLHITKRRMGVIAKHLAPCVTLSFYSMYTKQNETFEFHPSQITFQEYNSQCYVVVSLELTELLRNRIHTEELFFSHLKRVYKEFHSYMNISYEHLIRCIQKMDVMNTQCENVRTYHYCKPVLQESDKSFVKATKMRHALIEHLELRESYVANDVDLGGETQGVLLFGTNAVGKTSYIKSIGICVILAQAGMYVPCETFVYHPYEYLFTRIIGNDNLFKGLSTFAVEMSELRVILQKCNQNSLILGDELCSGTEIDSALSIFVSGLMDIYQKQSSFIFATHFHTLQTFEEIQNMTRLKMKHLTVQYNYERQTLVYGRTLCDGPGESTYGLEVCKSLALPEAFLKRAYDIRNRQLDQGSILLYKESKYNKEKIRTLCEFCKKNKGTEIHHLEYQKDDAIPMIHHVSNLTSICEKCHQHIHALGLVYEKRKTLEGDYVFLTKSKLTQGA